MADTLSEAVLRLLHSMATGQDQRAALAFLLEQAVVSTQRQLEAFLEHAPQNPEFAPDLSQRVEHAMVNLKDCFEQARVQLGHDAPGDTWLEPARRLEQALERLFQIQEDHQAALKQGPTTHILLNRMLLHLEAWESGQPPGPLSQELIDSLADFEDHLANCIDPVEATSQPGIHEALADLMNSCDEIVSAFQAGQASPEDLAGWRKQLIVFSQDFDLALSLAMESRLAEGPTRLAAVNLVMVAIERFLYEEISAEMVIETLGNCELLLRSQLDHHADTTMLDAADSVFSVLQDLRLALDTGDEQLLLVHQDNLTRATDHLARYAALLSCEESVLDLVSAEGVGTQWAGRPSSLPLLLAEILQHCNGLLRGQGVEGLEKCRKALHRLVSSIKSQLKTAKDAAPVKDRTRRTVEILDRACHCIDVFMQEPNDDRYASIEELLHQAGDLAIGLAVGNV